MFSVRIQGERGDRNTGDGTYCLTFILKKYRVSGTGQDIYIYIYTEYYFTRCYWWRIHQIIVFYDIQYNEYFHILHVLDMNVQHTFHFDLDLISDPGQGHK